jgi:hypothetical protein
MSLLLMKAECQIIDLHFSELLFEINVLMSLVFTELKIMLGLNFLISLSMKSK